MRLPPAFQIPPRVALARSVERVPEPGALPGECRYEPKWDGYRAVLLHDGTAVRLLSRRGTDLSDRFPGIIAALTDQLRPASVLDGEFVIWFGSRLDFDALRERLALGPRNAVAAARQPPASLVVSTCSPSTGMTCAHDHSTSGVSCWSSWPSAGVHRSTCHP